MSNCRAKAFTFFRDLKNGKEKEIERKKAELFLANFKFLWQKYKHFHPDYEVVFKTENFEKMNKIATMENAAQMELGQF